VLVDSAYGVFPFQGSDNSKSDPIDQDAMRAENYCDDTLQPRSTAAATGGEGRSPIHGATNLLSSL
jgi:hypothetical protein